MVVGRDRDVGVSGPHTFSEEFCLLKISFYSQTKALLKRRVKMNGDHVHVAKMIFSLAYMLCFLFYIWFREGEKETQ